MSTGEWTALNVSQNASGWMFEKGYAVNGAAHIKYYEGVTEAREAGYKEAPI